MLHPAVSPPRDVRFGSGESSQIAAFYPLNYREYQYNNVFEYIDMFTAWVMLAPVLVTRSALSMPPLGVAV